MALLTNINGKFSVSDVGAVTFNNAFTFPTADGAANYVLQTNGSGQLAWALNGNGDISGSGTANTVTRFTGSGTGVKTIGDGPITFTGAGTTATSTFGNAIRINGTTTTGLVIASSSGSSNGLKLYNNSTTDNAYIYNHFSGNLEIGTNNATVLTLNGTTATFAGNLISGGSETLLL